MLTYNNIFFALMILGTFFFSACEVEAIRAAGECSADDWAGEYFGTETCVDPGGMQTGDTLTLTGTIITEGNNVIDFSWVDNTGDAVQFLAALNDDDFCKSSNNAFPAGDTSFVIEIETERMSDGSLVQTAAFISNGFNFQNCTTIWIKR